MDVKIRPARKEDMESMEKLLRISDLNAEGLDDENTFFLITEDASHSSTALIGIAGIEKRGSFALLRSLVFDNKRWSSELGIRFLTTIIHFVEEINLKEIYLLTSPMSIKLFEQLQFTSTILEEVPDEIKASKHFLKTYKESVVIMKREQFVKK